MSPTARIATHSFDDQSLKDLELLALARGVNKSELLRNLVEKEALEPLSSALLNKSTNLCQATVESCLALSAEQWPEAKMMATKTLEAHAALVAEVSKSGRGAGVTKEQAMADAAFDKSNPAVMFLGQLASLNSTDRFQAIKNYFAQFSG